MSGTIYAVQDFAPPGIISWDADGQHQWGVSSNDYYAVARDDNYIYACTETTIETWSFDGQHQSTADLSSITSLWNNIVWLSIHDSDFYIGTSWGYVHRLDSSFSVVWSQTDPGGWPEGASNFVFTSDAMYYVNSNRRYSGSNAIQKLNLADGSVAWGPYYFDFGRGQLREIAVVDGRLFVGTNFGLVAELDPDGPQLGGSGEMISLNEEWVSPNGGEIDGLLEFDGGLVAVAHEFVSGNRVLHVHRLSLSITDTTTKHTLTGHNQDSVGADYSTTRVDQAMIVYSSASRHVWSYNPSTHDQNWYMNVWNEPGGPYMLDVAERILEDQLIPPLRLVQRDDVLPA